MFKNLKYVSAGVYCLNDTRFTEKFTYKIDHTKSLMVEFIYAIIEIYKKKNIPVVSPLSEIFYQYGYYTIPFIYQNLRTDARTSKYVSCINNYLYKKYKVLMVD